jgi:hypothetical protein
VTARPGPGGRNGPLALLIVDGDNFLHEIRGRRDEGGMAWLLPRLTAWRPNGLHVVVALDGHAAPGLSLRQRGGRGVDIRHAGGRSADDLIVELLSARPYAERTRTVVVTRDRHLASRVREAYGVVHANTWLLERLEGPSTAPGSESGGAAARIGRGRPGRTVSPAPDRDELERDAPEREPWQPGRGATRKRGNPRRAARAGRRR